MKNIDQANRRTLLRGLAYTTACALSGAIPYPSFAATETSLPVLMFHKIENTPRYPEDISPAQLEALFQYAWRSGYRPVTMSDIVTGRVDAVVPRGCKPLGISADDAHRSILFAHPEQDLWGSNDRSFVEILASSLKPYALPPRASLFISRVNDDRVSKHTAHYFGSPAPLQDIVATLRDFPGIELGYHTLPHTRMSGMDGHAVHKLLEAQRTEFQRAGVLNAIAPVLAYPYGCPPTEQGVAALKDMGFTGAVLAFPGINEARYTTLPSCLYNGELQTDPFYIPRVGIGAWTYNTKGAPGGPYLPIDPLEDFRKDVEKRTPSDYVSRGIAL